ncbi:MAG: putative small protein (TIGR04563 family) [Bradymonadia bacterium]|jgi:uncharacterized small protein (TIGR04563 family)
MAGHLMKNKVTVYMSDTFHQELKEAAEDQQRSVSWLIEHSWRLSRRQILDYPSVHSADESLAS